jgi:Tfp pilus assembly protein FimV
MRKTTPSNVVANVIGVLGILLLSPAEALQLTELRTQSKLSQPLSAWIELLPAYQESLGHARVELLAHPEYRANQSVSDIVATLQSRIVTPGNGRSYLEIDSEGAVNESIMGIRVRVHLEKVIVTRDYTKDQQSIDAGCTLHRR